MKQQGVTLLELIVCIGIIGLLASTAMLVVGQSLQRQELESASLLLANDLRWLQQLSINSGIGTTSYILQFNKSEPSYYIMANTKVIRKYVFPRSIRLYAPYTFISFSLSGAPLIGAQTVSLQSNQLQTWKYVILAPVTGRVRISDTNPHQWED